MDEKENTRELVVVDVKQYKKVKKALQESEERYRQVFENVPIGIYRSTLDGRIVDANPAMVKMAGFASCEEMLSLKLDREYAKSGHDRSEFIRLMERDGEVKGLETIWRTRDGNVIHVRENAKLVRGKDGQVFFEGTIEDITQSKEAEAAQKSRTQQLEILNGIISSGNMADSMKELLDCILDKALQPLGFNMIGIFRYDPETKTVDMIANRGMPKSFFLNKKYLSLESMPFSQVLLRGQPVFVDNASKVLPALNRKWKWKMAASIPMLSKGRVVGAINVASCNRSVFSPEEKNILGLIGKEAGTLISKLLTETALRASEKYYRTLIDTSPEIIVVVGLDAKLQMVNQQFLKTGGYFYDEVIGASVYDFVAGLDRIFLQKKTANFIKKKKASGSDYLFKKKDGRNIPLEVTASLLNDGQGRPIGIIAIGRDISEHKHSEEVLRRSEDTFRRTFEAIPDPAYIWTKQEDGRFHLERFNRAAALVTKNKIKSFIGFEPERLFADYPELIASMKAGLQKGEIHNAEFLYKYKSTGESRWLMVDYAKTSDDSVLVITKDVTEHKHIDEVLHSNEETFRRTFEAIPDPSYIWTLEPDGRLILSKFNQAAAQITEGKIKNFVGIEAQKLFAEHPDFVSKIRLAMDNGQRQFSEGLYTYKTTHKNKWLQVDYVKTAENTVMAITKDISGRKQAELQRETALDALRQSESKYRELVENHNDVIFCVDASGEIKYISPAITRITGYTPEEITGRNLYDFIGPEEQQQFGVQIQNTAAAGSSDGEYLITIKDKSKKWVRASSRSILENGKVVGIRGIMSDISERKQSEHELRESKALIDAVVENVPLMIFLKEATDLRFVVFNRAGEELLGYDRASLLGKNNLDLFPPEQAAHFMTKDREVLDGESGMLDIPEEHILTAKQGERLLHTRKICIRGGDGATKYLLGISEDITERKEAEAKLLAYQEQLRALTSEMMLVEEKERRRIAAELHDQIGQNLALCKLKVADLEKNLGDDAMKGELAMVSRLLECSIQDARSLIFDLSPPVLYELGFLAALEWLAERIQEQFHIPVEFESRLKDSGLQDDQQVILFQVVRELLMNVGKHSRASQAKIILTHDGPLLKIQVNDDGVGFDASQVFAPREPHHGFGFFSMRERLNYLGGGLDVKSKPGQGSQIILTVRLQDGGAAAKKENA